MKTCKEYTHRIILISDTHYIPGIRKREYDALYADLVPKVDGPPASGDIYGYTISGKMGVVLEDVNTIAENNSVDAILVLGDLGTDDYGYRNMPENYAQKFRDDVMAKFPVDSYVLPGNHDSYPNEMWRELFGYDRQYSFKIGDAAFIMLDPYRGETAVGQKGSPDLGTDMDWLEKEVTKYPTEQIFLCTHYLYEEEENERLNQLFQGNKRIVCVFRGHSHKNGVYACTNLQNKTVIDLGGYAYDGRSYKTFYPEYAWGYGILEWNDTEAHYYHVKSPRTYDAKNGVFHYAGAIEDDIEFVFHTI